jgi:hypothetical protein
LLVNVPVCWVDSLPRRLLFLDTQLTFCLLGFVGRVSVHLLPGCSKSLFNAIDFVKRFLDTYPTERVRGEYAARGRFFCGMTCCSRATRVPDYQTRLLDLTEPCLWLMFRSLEMVLDDPQDVGIRCLYPKYYRVMASMLSVSDQKISREMVIRAFPYMSDRIEHSECLASPRRSKSPVQSNG